MRRTLAAIMLVSLPAVAAGQAAGRSHALPPNTFAPQPTIGLPLPPMGLPQPPMGLPHPPMGLSHPPMGLPLPPMGLSPRVDPQFRSGRNARSLGIQNRQHRFDRRGSLGSKGAFVYVAPSYGWDYPYPFVAPTPTLAPGYPEASYSQPEPQRTTGTLQLDVQPRRIVQVYVDGYYVGTQDDFYGELELEAGPHQLEFRAPGYDTLDLQVIILPDGAATYRDELKAQDARPAPGSTVRPPTEIKPAAPTTFYIIPGCYAGNVPPKEVALPATCDRSRVVTFKR